MNELEIELLAVVKERDQLREENQALRERVQKLSGMVNMVAPGTVTWTLTEALDRLEWQTVPRVSEDPEPIPYPE